MSKKITRYRFLFAAGGTGGHLYPAVAVAQKIKELKPEADILFVGTKGKIESEVIPKLGFKFKSFWISGFSRKFKWRNLLFPLKVIVSIIQSLFLNIKFKPKVAVGAGAYVSGPALWGSSFMGAKIILLEQNIYPGITNRLLEKKAEEIHLTFDESKKYFRQKEKLFVSGNPVRIDLQLVDKNDARKKFGLNQNKKTVLILGGSLGARSINNAVKKFIKDFHLSNIQLVWQTGKLYYDEYKGFSSGEIKVFSFIEDMSVAYSAADLVVARAGATTIAEASALGIAVIFVPSPNVAANHQYKNAKLLTDKNAGVLLNDPDVEVKLFSVVNDIINDEERLNRFRNNIKKFSKPEAAVIIAQRAIKLAEEI